MQYAYEYEAAEVAYNAGGGAGAVAGTTARLRIGPAALPFSFAARQAAKNGRMFNRRANGILSDLTKDLPEYNHTATILPYNLAYAGVNVPAGAIRFQSPELTLTALPAANAGAPTNWTDAYTAANTFSKSGRVTYLFDRSQAPWNAHFAAQEARYDDKNAYASFPTRSEYFWSNQGVLVHFSGKLL